MIKINWTVLVWLAIIFLPIAAMGQDRRLVGPSSLVFDPIKFSIPEPDRVVLENGLVLYLLEDHELPLLRIQALLKTGQVYDPPEKKGAAKLTGDVMRSGGTKTMSPDEINQTLEFMAATVEVALDIEQGRASLDVLKKDVDLGLKIFADILRGPAFDENKFQLAKNREIERIRRIVDNPEELVFRQLRRSLYDGNPRGLVPTADSVNRVTRQDLVDFHTKFFVPDRIIMAVSGDFEKKEIVDKVKAAFGSWQRSAAPLPPMPTPSSPKSYPVVLVPKDLPQSTIACALLAPSKNDPDFFPFTVLNQILGGGGFRSKLMAEIRTNRGLAYAIGSFYRSDLDYGVLGAMGQTKTTTTAQTIGLMLNIIDEFRSKKVTEEDLKWAKDSLINKFIFSFETAEAVALQYAMLEYYGLAGDFLKNYQANIAKVAIDDILRVASKYISSEKQVLVVVGKGESFEDALSAFGKVKKVKPEES